MSTRLRGPSAARTDGSSQVPGFTPPPTTGGSPYQGNGGGFDFGHWITHTDNPLVSWLQDDSILKTAEYSAAAVGVAAATVAGGGALLGAGAEAGAGVAEAGEVAEGETYEILDGVRRAKAAAMAGQETIQAEVIGSGGKVVNVGVDALRSPKAVIDATGPGLGRWLSTLRQTLAGSQPPPILVQPGSVGTTIARVIVSF